MTRLCERPVPAWLHPGVAKEEGKEIPSAAIALYFYRLARKEKA